MKKVTLHTTIFKQYNEPSITKEKKKTKNISQMVFSFIFSDDSIEIAKYESDYVTFCTRTLYYIGIT